MFQRNVYSRSTVLHSSCHTGSHCLPSTADFFCCIQNEWNKRNWQWVRGEYFTPKTIGLAAALVYGRSYIPTGLYQRHILCTTFELCVRCYSLTTLNRYLFRSNNDSLHSINSVRVVKENSHEVIVNLFECSASVTTKNLLMSLSNQYAELLTQPSFLYIGTCRSSPELCRNVDAIACEINYLMTFTR